MNWNITTTTTKLPRRTSEPVNYSSISEATYFSCLAYGGSLVNTLSVMFCLMLANFSARSKYIYIYRQITWILQRNWQASGRTLLIKYSPVTRHTQDIYIYIYIGHSALSFVNNPTHVSGRDASMCPGAILKLKSCC